MTYYTYYTVERLNPKKNKPRCDGENVVDSNDFYNEIKECFTEINKELEKILDNQKFIQEYKTVNGFLCSCFQIENILSGDDKEKLRQLEKKGFHIEIKEINKNTIILIFCKFIDGCVIL